mgnify:CR=1 FL=1
MSSIYIDSLYNIDEFPAKKLAGRPTLYSPEQKKQRQLDRNKVYRENHKHQTSIYNQIYHNMHQRHHLM